jgi:hypothetical protein
VDDVPGGGDAREHRQQEQNRRRAAGHGERGLDLVGLRTAGIDLAATSLFPPLFVVCFTFPSFRVAFSSRRRGLQSP